MDSRTRYRTLSLWLRDRFVVRKRDIQRTKYHLTRYPGLLTYRITDSSNTSMIFTRCTLTIKHFYMRFLIRFKCKRCNRDRRVSLQR